MKKKVILSAAFLLLCIAAALYLSYAMHHGKFAIQEQATYPAFSLEEMTDQASQIVYGTVVGREKTKTIKIPVNTGFDTDDTNQGKFLEETVTEVKIQVEELIKGAANQENAIVTYNESGVRALHKGDKVVLFLNEAGFTWGEQGVLRVTEDNRITTNNYDDEKTYNLSRFIEKIQKFKSSE
ncbi:hypothetical protein CDO73_06885 [Saccharibacillus sp. O23]|uniref:hypothetical protein n=1 Tax=Saccharibacillus sp. O23 TaxID=2009338 RepID=UPI000B4E3FFA|nr:hypothetical protein [Saccharibacillus sp. O23]OWR31447.1 hypothetical protein CDO73_06885 [Saccharibacillus sp. O23]